ncbi:MAG: hypothetical protein ACYCXP_00465 [Leptospirillum sp.]
MISGTGFFARSFVALVMAVFLSGCGVAGVPTPPGSTPPEKPRAIDKESGPSGGQSQPAQGDHG